MKTALAEVFHPVRCWKWSCRTEILKPARTTQGNTTTVAHYPTFDVEPELSAGLRSTIPNYREKASLPRLMVCMTPSMY